MGDRRLELQQGKYDNAKLHAFLGHWIYRDQIFIRLPEASPLGRLGVFFVGLLVAIPKDAARARARKEGRRLKGPEIVTEGSSIEGIVQMASGSSRRRSSCRKLFGRVPTLKLPRAIEPSHILIMGDTGTGKSTLIRRILFQIEAAARRPSSTTRHSITRRSSTHRSAATRFSILWIADAVLESRR